MFHILTTILRYYLLPHSKINKVSASENSDSDESLSIFLILEQSEKWHVPELRENTPVYSLLP